MRITNLCDKTFAPLHFGREITFEPWHKEASREVDEMEGRMLLQKYGAESDWPDEEDAALRARPLRATTPDLVPRLVKRWSRQPDYFQTPDGAQVREDLPTEKWAKSYVLAEFKRRGWKADTNWSKDRTLKEFYKQLGSPVPEAGPVAARPPEPPPAYPKPADPAEDEDEGLDPEEDPVARTAAMARARAGDFGPTGRVDTDNEAGDVDPENDPAEF